MKTRSLAVLVLVTCFFALTSWATPVGTNDAARAVRAWVKRGGTLGARLGRDVVSVGIHATTNGIKFYSVQTRGGGTVFTSADDALEPILAFTSENAAEAARNPNSPLYALLNRDVVARTPAQSKLKLTTSSVTKSKWAALLSEAAEDEANAAKGKLMLTTSAAVQTVGDLRVPPLVQTKWSQQADGNGEPCYNYYVPGNRYCGCVATAMAQIMRYHRWPAAGLVTDKVCYIDDNPVATNTLGGVYSWADMPLEPNGADYKAMTDVEREAIGHLCYDAGVSVRMNWGYYSSGTFAALVGEALRDVFGYGSAYSSNGEETYADPDGIEHKILSNLNAGYPVLLGISYRDGYNVSNGHAIVGDGYGYNGESLYVHLNMGWSGSDDLWYQLPDMSEEYNCVDDIVYNIIPDGADDKAVFSGRITVPSGAPASYAKVAIYISSTETLVTNVEANAYGVYGVVLPANATYELRATIDPLSGTETACTLGAPTLEDYNFSARIGEEQVHFSTTKFATSAGNDAASDVTVNGEQSGVPLAWTEDTTLDATQLADFSHTFTASGGNTPYAWSVVQTYTRQDGASSTYDSERGERPDWPIDSYTDVYEVDLGFEFPFGDQLVSSVSATLSGIKIGNCKIGPAYASETGCGSTYYMRVASDSDSFTVDYEGEAFTLHSDGTITVSFDQDAESRLAPRLVVFGQQLEFPVAETGSVNDMTLTRKGLPVGLALDAALGTLSGKPEFAGDQDFDMVVTDPFGKSLTNMFTLAAVATTNGKPVIDSIEGYPEGGVMSLKSGEEHTFTVHVSDPDEDMMTVKMYVNGDLHSVASSVSSGGSAIFQFSGEINMAGEMEDGVRNNIVKFTVSDVTWVEKVTESCEIDLCRDWYFDASAMSGYQDGSAEHPFNGGLLAYFGYMFGGDGDTVYAKPGEYYHIEIMDDMHVTFIATEGADVTSIQNGVSASGYGGKGFVYFENVIVRGFTVGGAVGGTLEHCRIQNVSYSPAVCGSVLVNCTVAANAGDGVVEATLYNCTVAGNGGLGLDAMSTAYNTIIWGNDGGNVEDCAVLYNCCYEENPMLADASLGDCRLRSGSPCIDAGNNGYVPEGLTNDLAGAARIQNTVVDIGAYEGASISGFGIQTSVVGKGGILTKSASFVEAGGEITFTFSGRPLNHITTNGVEVIVVGDTFVWRDIRADGELVAYFDALDFYVDAENGSDGNDGTTIGTAFATLTNALAHAVDGETIYALPGVYGAIEHWPDENNDPIHIRIESTGGAAVTVIDGEGEKCCVYDEADGLTVVGFTLRNGKSKYFAGGGAYQGTYYSCVITNCVATSDGGGASLATLYDCTIVGNTAGSLSGSFQPYGGGLYNCTASNCIIRANCALGKTYVYGGGFVYGTLMDCRVYDNYACTSKSSVWYCEGGGGYYGTADGNTYIWNNVVRTEDQFDYPSLYNVYNTNGDFHEEEPPSPSPVVPPGEDVNVPSGYETADEFAEALNTGTADKADYLKAPGDVTTTPEYLSYFSAVPSGAATVAFVLNDDGTNAVKAATEVAATNALAVVLSSSSTLTIADPLVGFYYSLKQGGVVTNLLFNAEGDRNKLGGRDAISFDLTKPKGAGFYQTLVTPTEIPAE